MRQHTGLNRKSLMAGVAASALTLGLSAGAAQAFDDVDWAWDKQIDDNVVKNANVDIDVAPSGFLDMQKFQLHVGDQSATSTVTDVTNDRVNGEADGEPQVVTINGRFDDEFVEITGDEELAENAGENNAGFSVDQTSDNAEAIELALTPATGGGSADAYQLDLRVDPSVIGEATVLDARTELPTVSSSATAVANNQTIESEVSTELHDGQVAFGDFTGPTDGETGGGISEDVMTTFEGTNDGIDNQNMSAALAAATAGFEGSIEKASISAASNVSDIENARVDSSATSVTNNMSVALNAATADDAVAVADITQAGFADNTATSSVKAVEVNNYSNLGKVDPMVDSSATAVGNNLSVTVNSPAEPGDGGGSDD